MSIQTPGQYPTPEEIAAQMEQDVQAALKPEPTAAAKVSAKADVPPTPLTWEARVKAAGLSEDQAQHILTEIITKGFFERSFLVYGRVPVVLRSRDGYVRGRLLEIYDQFRVMDPRVYSETYLRVALAGSLVKFGAETFPHTAPGERDPQKLEAAFAERLAAVNNMADPVLEETLFPLISRFDQWVYAALSNGAPAGF